MNKRIMVYDLEIKKAIQGKSEPKLAGIEYCSGWQDHANMGISCGVVYDYRDDRYRVFMDDNKEEFKLFLDEADILVGFNHISFDNNLLAANGIRPKAEDFDILVEVWKAAGLGPAFRYLTHAGYGLDAVCAATTGYRKNGHGAIAPVDFQRGKYGSLIDYCINDVRLTKGLLDLIRMGQALTDPKTGRPLDIKFLE